MVARRGINAGEKRRLLEESRGEEKGDTGKRGLG